MTNAYEIVEAGADVETQVVLVVHAAVKANFAGNTADKRRTGTAEICYRWKASTEEFLKIVWCICNILLWSEYDVMMRKLT
jgi:hypothetical protein